MNKKRVIFVGGARDYHAMDWYRNAKEVCTSLDFIFATDLIGGEGFKIITKDSDYIIKLFIIDKLLFRYQSKFGDKWRNLLKLLVLPIQVRKLKKVNNNYANTIYHAHGMYYMLMCMYAKVPYIGTPQGSEILVRPFRSKIYKHFAIKVLRKAKYVTVDSLSMQEKIKDLSNVDSIIIQNGIDIETIEKKINSNVNRDIVLSVRGLTSLYRIEEILLARNNTEEKHPIHFIYPFWDESYKERISKYFSKDDVVIGRVGHTSMYNLLNRSILVLSIPISDSSPRSVYEAIFCGACVGVRENAFYNILPDCMKERIIVLDLNQENWFEEALIQAKIIVSKEYIPSKEAKEIFDEKKSIKILANNIYHK